MTDTKDNTWASIAVIVGMPAYVLWYGFALVHLWGWFVVPFGAPAIGLWWACGLSLLLGSVTIGMTSAIDKSDARLLALMVTKPAFMLGLGWIYHYLMTA